MKQIHVYTHVYTQGPRDAGFLLKQNTLMKIGLAITLVILGLVVVVSMSM